MKQKQLDLTFIQFCNEKAEISARNGRAKKYIRSKENRLEKVIDKILPLVVGLAVASSIIALCVVEWVHYDIFGTLL